MKRRRYRVAVRRRVQRERLAQQGVVAAVLGLALLAVLAVRHSLARLPAWDREVVSFSNEPQWRGVPAMLEPRIARLVEGGRSSEALAKRVKDGLPCVRAVEVDRDWRRRRLVFTVTTHQAVAQARKSGAVQYLAEDGTLFGAPAGLYPADLPLVETGASGVEERRRLAALLAEARRGGPTPAPLRSMRFVSASEGWEGTFEDGTRVLWGDLRWGQDKLSRLAEALRDARVSLSGALVADLRYFEDGRILVRRTES